MRQRHNQRQERLREREKWVQSGKKSKTNAEMWSRVKPEKRSENPSLSLSLRVGHWQSATCSCRILSLPSIVSLEPMLLWSLKAPPLPTRNPLTRSLSLTLPICCYVDNRPIGFRRMPVGHTAAVSWSGQEGREHIVQSSKITNICIQRSVHLCRHVKKTDNLSIRIVCRENRTKPIRIQGWRPLITCSVQILKMFGLQWYKTEKSNKASHPRGWNQQLFCIFNALHN